MRVTAVYNYHYHDRLLVHFDKADSSSHSLVSYTVSDSLCTILQHLVFLTLIPSLPILHQFPFMHALIYASTWIVYTRVNRTVSSRTS